MPSKLSYADVVKVNVNNQECVYVSSSNQEEEEGYTDILKPTFSETDSNDYGKIDATTERYVCETCFKEFGTEHDFTYHIYNVVCLEMVPGKVEGFPAGLPWPSNLSRTNENKKVSNIAAEPANCDADQLTVSNIVDDQGQEQTDYLCSVDISSDEEFPNGISVPPILEAAIHKKQKFSTAARLGDDGAIEQHQSTYTTTVSREVAEWIAKLPLPPNPQRLFCSLCGVELSSKLAAQCHFASQEHYSRLVSLSTDKFKHLLNVPPGWNWCPLCSADVSLERFRLTHSAGRRHRTKHSELRLSLMMLSPIEAKPVPQFPIPDDQESDCAPLTDQQEQGYRSFNQMQTESPADCPVGQQPISFAGLTCPLCQVKLTSQDLANQHFSSIRHVQQLVEAAATEASDLDQTILLANWCPICNVDMHLDDDRKSHLEMASHLQAVDNLTCQSSMKVEPNSKEFVKISAASENNNKRKKKSVTNKDVVEISAENRLATLKLIHKRFTDLERALLSPTTRAQLVSAELKVIDGGQLSLQGHASVDQLLQKLRSICRDEFIACLSSNLTS